MTTLTPVTSQRVRGRPPREAGVALALVLAVLVCLLTVAIPFALSMRHEQEGVTFRSHDREARRVAESARDLALASLAGTAPDRDTTPWNDGPDELAVDVAARAAELGLPENSARDRLVSAQIEDQSGRIDLNRAGLFALARALGLSTRLAGRLAPDDPEMRLFDGSFLQDEGWLWIDGEITWYKRRDGNVVGDFTRPALVPDVWVPTLMPKEAREFASGTEVIDIRAWMVAAELWKLAPRRESRFETLTQPFAIARHGRGALAPEQRVRLERLFTIWQNDAGRDRFGGAQRVTKEIISGETDTLRLEQGHFVGRGTLCRVRTYGGRTDYGFVTGCDAMDDGFRVILEMPLVVSAPAYQAVAEFLLPRPVNVNTCSAELLELLLTGLRLRTTSVEVDAVAARRVAERIIAARPLPGPQGLIALLDQLEQKERVIKQEQRQAIQMNADHSGAVWLETGTLPFCYASDGIFDVRAAASLNYALTGREKARAFLREVVTAPASGRCVRLFATQRDFEEPWRMSRLARGWTTFPENLDVFDGYAGLGGADPPSRLPAMTTPILRYPKEDLADVGARLRPGRIDVPFHIPGTTDVTLHFDQGRYLARRVDGWSALDGGDTLALDAIDPETGIRILGDVAGQIRQQPFALSLWWNPGEALVDQHLFDTGNTADPWRNRIRLRLKSRILEFDVYDAFERVDENEFAARIVYDFTDGMTLDPDTWYHVTAFCRGNRGDQMCLWVDGKPRGRWTHLSRVPSSVANTDSSIPADPKRLPTTGLKTFLSQPNAAGGGGGTGGGASSQSAGTAAVVRLGGEVIEGYVNGNQITVPTSGTGDPFGTRNARNTFGATHPAQSRLEPYGYAALLATTVTDGMVNLADALAQFGVAQLDPTDNNQNAPISLPGQPPLNLGMGLERPRSQTGAMDLALAPLPGATGLDDNLFQQTGGYALLMSYRFGGGDASRPGGAGGDVQWTDGPDTVEGHELGGAEVIYYEQFNNTGAKPMLLRVHRGGELGGQFSGGSGKDSYWRGLLGGQPQTSPFFAEHAFILVPQIGAGGFGQGAPPLFPTLVIPLGVRVSEGTTTTRTKFNFAGKQPIASEQFLREEFLQIGRDFTTATGGESTEWVRYKDIVPDGTGQGNATGANFVNDDGFAIDDVFDYLSNDGGDDDISGDIGTWSNPQHKLTIIGNGSTPVNFVTEVRDAWGFRGTCGTADSPHLSNLRGLPVFRTRQLGSLGGLPGRHDVVTVIGDGGLVDSFRATINHGWCYATEDWNGYSHFAFVDPAVRRIERSLSVPWDQGENGPSGINAYVNDLGQFSHDSRSHPRVLKFPSGELPAFPPARLKLGEFTGGEGGPIIDEVRVLGLTDGNPVGNANWEASSLVLSKDLQASGSSAFHLNPFGVRWTMKGWGAQAQLPPILALPEDSGVFQLGDEFVFSNGVAVGNDVEVGIAEKGRTRYDEEPGFHLTGELVHQLPFLVTTRLARGMGTNDSRITLNDMLGFPRRGCVLIDEELLSYTDLQPGESGGELYVPSFMEDPDGTTSGDQGDGAFRGRYGTLPAPHAADAVVLFWPWRFADGYVERCEIPEMASFELTVAARRALFHTVRWKEKSNDLLVNLVATARVMGKGDFAADPREDPDFFFFEQPGTDETPNRVDRQGDLLRLRFHVRYRTPAFDPIDFTRNSWKRAPTLELAAVEYLAEQVVELHEEWR